jgi:calpain-7
LTKTTSFVQQTHGKAAKAEFAKDYDQAFRLYVKAAEAFLHLSRSASATDKKKLQWKTSAAKALERAEIIKKFGDASRNAASTGIGTSAPAVPNIRLTPLVADIFSRRQSEVSFP